MLKNIENQTGPIGTGNKRSAELMENSPMVSPSTETVNSDTQSDTENYALKRPRVSEATQGEKITPSKVIHVRNLPPDTSETEIMALATPFGQVTNMILMRNKRQAFVEMGDVSQAMELIKKHQSAMFPAVIRGQTVQVQYSATYTELKPGQRSHANGMKPTPVLHINVDNLLLPVSLPILHQIFSKFGVVEKIITFSKNNQFQALIQMSDVPSAQLAKQGLDGKCVFPNCCVLRIDFSKMLSVNVKYNNDKSRDYTNPTLPSGEDMLPVPQTNSLKVPKMQPPSVSSSQPTPPINIAQLQSLMPYGTVNQGAGVNSLNPLAAVNSINNYRILAAAAGINPLVAGLSGMPSQQLPTSLPSAMPTQLGQQTATNQLTVQSLGANQLQALRHLAGNPNHANTLNAQYALSNQLQTQRLLANQQQNHHLVAANQMQSQNIIGNQYQYVATHTSNIHPVIPNSMTQEGKTSPNLTTTSSTPSPHTAAPVVLVSNLNAKTISTEATLLAFFGVPAFVTRVTNSHQTIATCITPV